jgi:hypothetical protein
VVLVCQSGARAAQAQQRLAGLGIDRVHVLDGGITAHATAGGVIVRGRARWALERQVRLLAGTLVLAGLAAGRRMPIARLLAGGVGAGLTLSAITDTCTMGANLVRTALQPRGARDRTPEGFSPSFPSGGRRDGGLRPGGWAMIAGAGLGLLIGVLLGLLGGGGSILAVPALVYGAGVPLTKRYRCHCWSWASPHSSCCSASP